MQRNIEQLLNACEKIGTISSPSSTNELTIDILETADTDSLVGAYVVFKFYQDGKVHYALGRVVEVILYASPDIYVGKVVVEDVVKVDGDRIEPSILGTVPPTGTYIHLVDERMLKELSEIFYLRKEPEIVI